MPQQDQLGKVAQRVIANLSALQTRVKSKLEIGPNNTAYTPKELMAALNSLKPDAREEFAKQYPGGPDKLLDDLNAS